MAHVLVVDDDPLLLDSVKALLRLAGHEAVLAGSAKEALSLIDGGVDVLVTDFSMPEMNGVELIRVVNQRDPLIPAILLTAHGSETLEAQAMKVGAFLYVTKPIDIQGLSLAVDRAMEARSLGLENRRLTVERLLGRPIVASSSVMRLLLDEVERIGPRDMTVLVQGETGTGKEVITSLLHAHSRRSAGPLVRFNCAAVPTELAEAELFGHVRGAFTGAHQSRPGFFAQADRGTLVLDEVGELPLSVQAALLRSLQDGEIQPVGMGRIEKVDVRVVASTNRDLSAAVADGSFRKDLYFRLAVFELLVPPLRDRREDIPALAREFARFYGQRFGRPEFELPASEVQLLASADWPGNVRQLENTIARAVALGHASPLPTSGATRLGDRAATPPRKRRTEGLSLREQLDALERGVIARTLAEAGGNQSEAARRLGISRGALINRLRKYGLNGDTHTSD